MEGELIMTDLKNGIIEINGFEISSKTKPNEVEQTLSNIIFDNGFTKSKKGQGIYLKNALIENQLFNADLFFYEGKLEDIKLISLHDTPLAYEERFKADCEWLKLILGEPTKTGSNGVVYIFDCVQIGATNWECDGRSGPDEYISISF